MQDMMKKKEFFDPEGENNQSKSRKVGNSNRSNREKSEYSISNTTIYHNAVEKAQPENESNHIQQMEVDSEITFQLNRLRENMSSEDQIDTSDELINDVNVDDISGHQHDDNPNDHQEPQVSV